MHITVAIPAYTGMIHLSTMRSLFTDLLKLQSMGHSWSLNDECGNALIGDARGLIVSQFLATKSDCLVFVDSDVTWEAGALVKLALAPVDMVAGIYPQRRDPINYCVKWLDKKELWAVDGRLEVAGVPFGFVKLSRGMLETMAKAYSGMEFYCDRAPNERAFGGFADWRDGPYKMGEDYSFCKRWTELGGKVWVDPEIKMGHTGYKTFEGHLGNYLKGRK